MIEPVELLKTVSRPWFFVWEAPERNVDSDLRRIETSGGIVVRVIRGRRCQSRETLFQEWAAALQFPWYFGNNWNAFYDCLDDLSWFRNTPLLIGITNIDLVLRDAPDEFELFAETLSSVARRRNVGKDPEELDEGEEQALVPFHVGFHCEAHADKEVERLRRAGVGV